MEDSVVIQQPVRERRGLVRGHPTRCPRLDIHSFRHLPTARPPAGSGALPPLHPPTRVPLDPVLGAALLRYSPPMRPIHNLTDLDETLSQPTPATLHTLQHLDGDLMVLGASGKWDPPSPACSAAPSMS